MSIQARTSGTSHAGALPDKDDEVILGDVMRAVTEDFRWLVGVVFAVLALAGGYCLFAKPVFLANALIRIEQGDDAAQALMQLSSVASAMAPIPTDAEIAIMQSRDVIGPVVKKFRLDIIVRPKTVPVLGSLAAAMATPGKPAGAWLGMSSFAWGGEKLDVARVDVPPELEGEKLTLTVRDNQQYDLADSNGALLIRGKAGLLESEHGLTILVDQIVARPGTQYYVTRLNDVDAVTLFQKHIQIQEQGKLTGLVDISMENEDPQFASDVTNDLARSYLARHVQSKQANAQNMLTFLKNEEPRLKSELDEAEIALAQYQQKTGSITAGEEAKVYLAGSVEYEQQISAMRLQLAALEQRYGDDHPLIKSTHEQIAQLEAQRARFETRFRGLPQTQVQAVQLQRNAKVAGEIYELVLTREQELSVQKAGTGGNAQIVDMALRPGTPVKPKKALVMCAALMLGAILGVAVILARRKIFRGIDDPEVIERVFQLPVCGLIPLSEQQAKMGSSAMSGGPRRDFVLTHSSPGDVCVESLRSLRTSLQFAMMDARNRVIMVTGPVAGVGKSFLAVNVAVLLAKSGKRVLIVDADMRRGALDRYLGGRPEGGLAELLSNKIGLSEAIRQTGFEGLDFISCGQRPDNPAELLTSTYLADYLHECETRYDVVLIDTPPVLAVTDASLVGQHAGCSFLVMRSGMHRPFEIANAIKRLKAAGIELKGGIFNGVSSSERYGYGAVHRYLTTAQSAD